MSTVSAIEPKTWSEVNQWRRKQREAILKARMNADLPQRRAWNQLISKELLLFLTKRGAKSIGFYWPMKGEFDARPIVTELTLTGMVAALPVVVQTKAPLEFWRWVPGMALKTDIYNIPIPESSDIITPEVLLIPLVGFDSANYRLGYGGGYYDRTLASYPVPPFTVGIGFELSRLPTIHPQPHDIAMNVVFTENGEFK